MLEKRVVPERLLAIGPSECIHLEQTEVDAQLDFFLTVFAFKPPDDNLTRLVFPGIEQVGNIEIHKPLTLWSMDFGVSINGGNGRCRFYMCICECASRRRRSAFF